MIFLLLTVLKIMILRDYDAAKNSKLVAYFDFHRMHSFYSVAETAYYLQSVSSVIVYESNNLAMAM